MDLIEDIESLILKYKERFNLLETNKNKVDMTKSDEKIKSFDKQIEFHAKKEQEIKDQRKKNEKENVKEKKKIIQVEDLIERVNSELQIQKFNTLNEHLKSQEEVKEIEKKKKYYSGLLEVFEKVKDEATRIIKKKSENNSKKDESTIKNIEQEQKNFEINTLKNIENILPDSDSLIESINKSTENLK